MESIDNRKIELLDWLLSTCELHSVSLLPMLGDASTRRYFRVLTPQTTYIAMDAPSPQENCAAFVTVANTLRRFGVSAPEILFQDLEHGYLVVSDFGDLTYLNSLSESNADQLYSEALAALAKMQAIREVPDRPLPLFTSDFMRIEWAWFKEWYLHKLLKMDHIPNENQLDACMDLIIESAATQPQVFMHRDYHSANLMVLPDNKVGVLDFQDAFIGPVTYDLVSLLRDCYIAWPNDRVTNWVNSYRQMLILNGALTDVDQETFMRWFDLMGVQRHLKALMTFARKQVRDLQPRYLRHIPRTLCYLLNTTEKYPELAPLHAFLESAREKTDKCVA